MNKALFLSVFKAYELGSVSDATITELGEGLIHQTFLLNTSQGAYVLQAFNREVFQFPERISSNLSLLAEYRDSHPFQYDLPLPLKSAEGKNMIEWEGKLYRLFDFVQGTTIQEIESKEQAFAAGQAYGFFASWAKDVDLSLYQETIPNFHRLDLRYERFLEVASSKQNLDEEERSILMFYINQKPLVEAYKSWSSNLPLRLTHNDTKINNLIFSENAQNVKALIDLDTLMPGFLLYDLGDLIRTVACSVSETSVNWPAIHLNIDVYEELLKGYWSGIQIIATSAEKESLLLAGEIMTCIMGLRFFTDHLMGNVYYKVKYPEQNLHRAKNQMIFLRDQQAKRKILEEIRNKVCL